MQDYLSSGLKPTNRTGRTVTLFKSSTPSKNATFSPSNIFRPMALYVRSHASTGGSSASLRNRQHSDQPIASGSKDRFAPQLDVEDQQGATAYLSSTSNGVENTGGRHQNTDIITTPKVPFLNRKLDRSRSHKPTPGIFESSLKTASDTSLSPYSTSTTGLKASKSWATTLRARTVSSKASGSLHSHEELPAGNAVPGPSSEARTRSDESLEAGVSSHRVVGRGGSGSRPRVVVAEDQTPTFAIPTRKASLSPESQPVLRPSGRGGFASRPQVLAPPPPLPKLPISSSSSLPTLNSTSEQEQVPAPVFIRPGGRGGAGSRTAIKAKSKTTPTTGANSTSQPSSLLARLQKRKIKSQLQKGKGKVPEAPYGVHPVRDSMAYRIMNGSSSTLSTIQFSGDPQPRPRFFPDDESSHLQSIHTHITLTSLAPTDMAWTPTHSFASSNSDCVSSTSMNETPDDESQLDAFYIADEEEFQETRPTTPTYHHQRTLDKLTRTLGEAPTILYGPREQNRPKLTLTTAVAHTPPKSWEGKPKSRRRSSLSMSVSSIFMRPRSASSASTLASVSDNLPHHSSSDRSRRSEALSESWGLARNSYSTTPGSPMLFAAPSPTSARMQRQSRLSSPLSLSEDAEKGYADSGLDVPGTETELDSDFYDNISPLPSPALSRSQSVTLGASRRRSTWRASHSQSASMSVLDAGTLDAPPSSPIPKTHPKWLFPPDDEEEFEGPATAFSSMRRRQRRETTIAMASYNDEQGWTGEWNSDLQDVIKTLRNLH